jgi:hypothetical protein
MPLFLLQSKMAKTLSSPLCYLAFKGHEVSF